MLLYSATHQAFNINASLFDGAALILGHQCAGARRFISPLSAGVTIFLRGR